MKALFSALEAQYGEDFNWYLLPENKTYFNEEANLEIHPAHPLFGCKLQSIAKCVSNDDVLYISERETNPVYYVIHLTYSKQNAGDYPLFTRLKDIDAVYCYIKSSIDN